MAETGASSTSASTRTPRRVGLTTWTSTARWKLLLGRLAVAWGRVHPHAHTRCMKSCMVERGGLGADTRQGPPPRQEFGSARGRCGRKAPARLLSARWRDPSWIVGKYRGESKAGAGALRDPVERSCAAWSPGSAASVWGSVRRSPVGIRDGYSAAVRRGVTSPVS